MFIRSWSLYGERSPQVLPLKGVPYLEHLTNFLLLFLGVCVMRNSHVPVTMVFTFPQEHSNETSPNYTEIPATIRQNKPSHL